MENEWKSVNHKTPNEGEYVLVSIRKNNNYYKEIMTFKREENQWFYQNDTPLQEGLSVVGWKEAGSDFLG